MNIKKYICLAGLILPVVAMAQQDKTLCDFETPESKPRYRIDSVKDFVGGVES